MSQDDLLQSMPDLDRHTLSSVFDHFYPEIYRYVNFRLDDEQACEDIASEVFVHLMDALGKPGRTIQNVRGWLFGTASHLVADHLRARYRARLAWRVGAWDGLVAAPAPALETLVDVDWQRQAVRQALCRLTLDQQHVLALRFSETRSFDDIAQVMGKSVGAVKNLQYRALGALRRELAQAEVEHD